MFKGMKFVAIALVTLFVAEPAFAQMNNNIRPRAPALMLRKPLPPKINVPYPQLRVKIRPSQAAAIAQGQISNSKVVGVKLLPSGIYAVTLRTDSNVARIMVSGEDGSIN
jgi:hypothetical protein